jgi:hypothetical protein
LKDFSWKQLVITDAKFGSQVAGLKSVFYASRPTGEAEGSDVL